MRIFFFLDDREFSLHFLFSFLVGVFFLINLGLFLAMWLQACIWDGQRRGGACNMSESFSEMLQDDTRVQQWYLAWWGTYTMNSLVLVVFVAAYKIHSRYRDEVRSGRMRSILEWGQPVAVAVYATSVALYVILTILKLVTLLLVLFYPVGTQEATHYLVAGLAFTSGIACCFCLMVRRALLLYTFKQSLYPKVFFYFGLICVLVQIGMGVAFVATDNGVFEFTLSLLLVFDVSFQIWDFYFDKDPLEHLGLNTSPSVKNDSL